MSLYALLFGGGGPKQEELWNILGLEDYDVGRYRDIYVKDEKIILLTRNGGGNREEYESSFESLKTHPNYLGDWDCDWDRTYAEISFSIPEDGERVGITPDEVIKIKESEE